MKHLDCSDSDSYCSLDAALEALRSKYFTMIMSKAAYSICSSITAAAQLLHAGFSGKQAWKVQLDGGPATGRSWLPPEKVIR